MDKSSKFTIVFLFLLTLLLFKNYLIIENEVISYANLIGSIISACILISSGGNLRY